jgi:integrase/recombinase XerC
MEPAWEGVIRDFAAWMRYRNLSAATQRIYTSAAVSLASFLEGERSDPTPVAVTRRDIESFVRFRLTQVKPATVSADFRALQQFFKWLVREEEIDKNPMDGAQAPIVPEAPVPVLEVEQLRALIDSCKGNDLVSRRDNAIIRLLIDTGGRLSEIAELTVDDVDFDAGVCHVIGKGRRGRALPFGQATALALGRYLRSRSRDRRSDLPGLWLAEKGKGTLLANGISQMIRRRGDAVGVPGLHPHQFRHTAAHRWLAEGGGETDLMRIMGWKSPQMLKRYGASKADERARDAHRRLALGDRI